MRPGSGQATVVQPDPTPVCASALDGPRSPSSLPQRGAGTSPLTVPSVVGTPDAPGSLAGADVASRAAHFLAAAANGRAGPPDQKSFSCCFPRGNRHGRGGRGTLAVPEPGSDPGSRLCIPAGAGHSPPRCPRFSPGGTATSGPGRWKARRCVKNGVPQSARPRFQSGAASSGGVDANEPLNPSRSLGTQARGEEAGWWRRGTDRCQLRACRQPAVRGGLHPGGDRGGPPSVHEPHGAGAPFLRLGSAVEGSAPLRWLVKPSPCSERHLPPADPSPPHSTQRVLRTHSPPVPPDPTL